MIETIKQVAELQEELFQNYGLYGVKLDVLTGRPEAQIDLEDFLELDDVDIKEVKRSNITDFPYELHKNIEGVTIFTLLTKKEYEEYKKSRAGNTTKEKNDSL